MVRIDDEEFDQEFNRFEGENGRSLESNYFLCDVTNQFCHESERCNRGKKLLCGTENIPSVALDPLGLLEQEEVNGYVATHSERSFGAVANMRVSREDTAPKFLSMKRVK